MEMHISADRAMSMLAELSVTLKTETIPLLEGYGRVLAPLCQEPF